MKNQEAKAEAEKIIQEFSEYSCGETPEDQAESATQCAIIHVRRLMENTLVLTLGAKSHRVYRDQQEILTELERK